LTKEGKSNYKKALWKLRRALSMTITLNWSEIEKSISTCLPGDYLLGNTIGGAQSKVQFSRRRWSG